MNIFIKIALFWLIAVITPGPNSIVTINTVLKDGRKNGYLTVLGIVIGTAIWALSGFLGISILFKIAPLMYTAIKMIGAIYLIYFGIKKLMPRRDNNKSNDDKLGIKGSNIRTGVLVSLSNPKTAIFIASLFATIVPEDSMIIEKTIFFITITIVSFIWYLTLATVFSIKKLKDKYGLIEKKIEKIFGTVFVLFGIKILLKPE